MNDNQSLITQLASDESDQRREAALALGRARAVGAVEALISTLQDDEAEVRLAAMNALRLIHDERASIPIIKLLNDPDTAIRRGASTWFMTITGDQSALVEPLCEIMLAEDSRMSTREFAAMLLGKFGDERAVDALHQVMVDHPRLQTRVIQTLRRMADPRSVPVLTPLLADDVERRVQATAAKTLTAIDTPEARAAVMAWRQRTGKAGPDERK